MQFICLRKLLVASILLHCFGMKGMEDSPRPISWRQLDLKAMRQIVYDNLSADDKLNYRLWFAQLIENSDLAYDDLVSSRLRLAELNAVVAFRSDNGSSIRPPSPATYDFRTTPDDLGSPELARPDSPLGSSSSSLSDSEVAVNDCLTNDFSEATKEQIYVQKQMGLEVLTPRSLESLEKRALDLGLSIQPRGDSPASSGSEPHAPSPMPQIADNPLFTTDIETKSPESPLLPAETLPTAPLVSEEPAPIIRPHSAPPSLESSVIIRSESPATSRSSSESSCASSQVLPPAAVAHDESSSLLPRDIQSTTPFRAESPFDSLSSSDVDMPGLPSTPTEHVESIARPTSVSPLNIQSALRSSGESSSSSNVHGTEQLVPTNDFSNATQDQIEVQRAMGIDVLTPRSATSLEDRARELYQKVQNGNQKDTTQAFQQPIEPGAAIKSPDTSKLTKVLEVTGIVLALWTGTEAILAYKNISHQEWHAAKKWHDKADLLMRKTGNAMASRPSQLKDAIKRRFTN